MWAVREGEAVGPRGGRGDEPGELVGRVNGGKEPERRLAKRFLTFYIVMDYNRLTVTVSGGQKKDSAIHIHVSIVPQTPFPSGLPHNTEQRSLCHTVGPC